MKKVLLLACVSLVLAAPTVMAQGLNLNWNECANAGGVVDKAAGCALDFGIEGPLVCSIVNAPLVPQFTGAEAVLDLQVDAAALQDWWQMGAGDCRDGAVGQRTNFLASGPFGCLLTATAGSPWGGGGSGGVIYESGFGGVDRARIKVVAGLTSPGFIDASAPEWYIFALEIGRSATTTCNGCQTPACIVLNSINLTQPAGVGDFLVTNVGVRNHVTWQGGGTTDCPGATPTKSSSWGSVKSLYR